VNAEARMINPAPLDLDAVLSPEWLGAAIAGSGAAPLDVTGVRIVDTFGPSATKVRLELTFGPGAAAGTPTAYCIKGFFGADAMGYLSSGVQVIESRFYADVAPHLSMRTADCVHAGIDHQTKAGVLVMHDLISGGARFLTALEAYSVAQARSSLDQLARLHAASWTPGQMAKWDWVPQRVEELTQYQRVPAAKVTELMQAERGQTLPAKLRSGDRIYAGLAAIGQRNGNLGECLVHGDAHAGNVFEQDGTCGVVDWQLLQRGHWSQDIAYHIAAVLTVADRREHEQALLAHYLERLAAHGASAPTWDEAWLHYRQSLAYGLFLWAITIRVQPEIIWEFNHRLGTAVADHGSLELLGA